MFFTFSFVFFISGKALIIYIALVVGLLCLVSDTVNYYLTTILKRILVVVGTIYAHVILSLGFFVELLPTPLLYRLFNKDSLYLRIGNTWFINIDK